MKFNQSDFEYLTGAKFSNSHTFKYDFYEPIPNRIAFLKKLGKGKTILHLGCLDHQPLIEDKIKRNQWLHKELTDVAQECLGIDIDQSTLEYVTSKLGYQNIILGDFTETKFQQISSKHWDYAILGELLEHIDNPVNYLNRIKVNYGDCINKIVITVPNAWTQTTIRTALNSAEIINTDHRYWFTPFTLAKVILSSGMIPEDIYFTNRVSLTTRELIAKKLLSFIGKEPSYNFTYSSSIVAIASLKN